MTFTSKVNKRARPLLGTVVEIGVIDTEAAEAQELISESFLKIENIERAMSRFDKQSEVSQINDLEMNGSLVVSQQLWSILQLSEHLTVLSRGVFSISAAQKNNGRILKLMDERKVCRVAAGSIDLGGIAKGYAVDQAVEYLQSQSTPSGYVNAGGDIRVFGAPHPIFVRHPLRPSESVVSLELKDAAFATSAVYHDGKSYNQSGAVLDPRTGRAMPSGVSASVMAPTCVMADALTKCILMLKSEGDTLLHQFDARGFLVDGEHVTSYPRTEKTITSYAN
jgi:thiamine biosynthesis lipoprotein